MSEEAGRHENDITEITLSSGLDDDAQVIALWESGRVFAFTHEYNGGRVYYQAEIYIYK